VSKWDYLFSCVGQPQKSFQRCMNTGQLATAASYLMVMQALQPAEVTRHQSLLLLQCALGDGQWELGRDLLRFLKVGGEEATKQINSTLFAWRMEAAHFYRRFSSLFRMLYPLPAGDTGAGGPQGQACRRGKPDAAAPCSRLGISCVAQLLFLPSQ
jgi:hypothetical protein